MTDPPAGGARPAAAHSAQLGRDYPYRLALRTFADLCGLPADADPGPVPDPAVTRRLLDLLRSPRPGEPRWWLEVADAWLAAPAGARHAWTAAGRAEDLIAAGTAAGWDEVTDLVELAARIERAVADGAAVPGAPAEIRRETFRAKNERLALLFGRADPDAVERRVTELEAAGDIDRLLLCASVARARHALMRHCHRTGEHRVFVEQFLSTIADHSLARWWPESQEMLVWCGRSLERLGDRITAYACYGLAAELDPEGDGPAAPPAADPAAPAEPAVPESPGAAARRHRARVADAAGQLDSAEGLDRVFAGGSRLGGWLADRGLEGCLPPFAADLLRSGALGGRAAALFRQLRAAGGRSGWFLPMLPELRAVPAGAHTAAPPAYPPPPALPPAPGADPPQADPPQADLPRADPPEADTPEADRPWADPPGADTPEADRPWADPPGAAPSRVARRGTGRPRAGGPGARPRTGWPPPPARPGPAGPATPAADDAARVRLGIGEGGAEETLDVSGRTRLLVLGPPAGDVLATLTDQLDRTAWTVLWLHPAADGPTGTGTPTGTAGPAGTAGGRPPRAGGAAGGEPADDPPPEEGWRTVRPAATATVLTDRLLTDLRSSPELRRAVRDRLAALLPPCADPAADDCLADLADGLARDDVSLAFCDRDPAALRGLVARIADRPGLSCRDLRGVRRAGSLVGHVGRAVSALRRALWVELAGARGRAAEGGRIRVALPPGDPLVAALVALLCVASVRHAVDRAPAAADVPGDGNWTIDFPLQVRRRADAADRAEITALVNAARPLPGRGAEEPDGNLWLTSGAVPAGAARICVLTGGGLAGGGAPVLDALGAAATGTALVTAIPRPTAADLRASGRYDDFLVGALSPDHLERFELGAGLRVPGRRAADLGRRGAVRLAPGRPPTRAALWPRTGGRG